MNKVYIITKEGRAYSDEGLIHVYNTLSGNLGLNRHEETVYLQGYDQNRFGHFTELVKRDLDNGHKVYAVFSNQDPRLTNDYYELNYRALAVLTDCAAIASDTDEPLSDTWEILEAMSYARTVSEDEAQEGD